MIETTVLLSGYEGIASLQHLEDMKGPMPNRMDNRFHASRE
jgi:hypothetical protein